MVQPQEIDQDAQTREAIKDLKDGYFYVQSQKMLGSGENVQKLPEIMFVVGVKDGKFSGLECHYRRPNESGGSEVSRSIYYHEGAGPQKRHIGNNVTDEPLAEITGDNPIEKPFDLINILSQKLISDGHTPSLDIHQE